MKPIAVHLDRLAAALASKGVELKRTDLLQVAASAFGFHNQNEASAASQRGDLTPPSALPICRVDVPATPKPRTLVVLEDAETGMAYGVDAEFFDAAVRTDRAELYGPTPFGGMADLTHAAREPSAEWRPEEAATSMAHLDRVFSETRTLRDQIGDLTGADDAQADEIGQIENTLSRLTATLRGGSGDEADGPTRTPATAAEKASWGRDIAGMTAAVEDMERRHAEMALPTPATKAWSRECLTALRAGLRIAEDWKRSYEQEVRFGPDWKAWTHDLKRASTRGAAPLSDADLHKIRHAVADNHCKSTESERSQTRWRVGRIMEKYGRALLLRLDVAESMLDEKDLVAHGNAYVPIGALWRVTVMTDGDAHPTRLFRVGKGQDAETLGKEIARGLERTAGIGRIDHVEIRPAPDEEANLRLLDAARSAVACIPDSAPVRRAMVSAIRSAEKALPPVVGNPEPQPAPKTPPAHQGEGDREDWRHNIEWAEALQDAILLCRERYALDRGQAAAMLTDAFGFDLRRSHDVLEGRDPGVRASRPEEDHDA